MTWTPGPSPAANALHLTETLAQTRAAWIAGAGVDVWLAWWRDADAAVTAELDGEAEKTDANPVTLGPVVAAIQAMRVVWPHHTHRPPDLHQLVKAVTAKLRARVLA